MTSKRLRGNRGTRVRRGPDHGRVVDLDCRHWGDPSGSRGLVQAIGSGDLSNLYQHPLTIVGGLGLLGLGHKSDELKGDVEALLKK